MLRSRTTKKMRRGHRWFVYLLRCADGTLYAGVTTDIARRLAAHNAGRGAKYTRARRPVALAWSARAKDKVAAMRREWRIKALTRAEKQLLVARRPFSHLSPGGQSPEGQM
jgi:putative endonuclease